MADPTADGSFAASEHNDDQFLESDYVQLRDYPENLDYYSLLALPRDPPPTDAQIRSAYRTLTLSFHPDKQPADLQSAATEQYDRIRTAYETLIDPRKRAVYDMLGEDGVRAEWGLGGVMAKGGAAERQQVGVKTMDAGQFRRWFLITMKRRERKVINELVQAKGLIQLHLDARSMVETLPDGSASLHVPDLRTSSLALGYNFNAPVPDFSWLSRSKPERADEGTEEEADATATEPVVETSQLQFHAAVSGRLQRPTRDVTVVHEDTGEQEDRTISLPFVLMGKGVSLGATFRHAIQSDDPKRGVLRGPLLSFLGGSVVEIKPTLLPSPVIQTTISKSITPVEGTHPLQLVLRSDFAHSPFRFPPAVTLSVSRRIGVQGVAFCNWSTGSWFWPEVVSRLLAIITTPRDGIDFVVSQASSSCELGYMHVPVKQPSEGGEQHEEEDEEDDIFAEETGSAPRAGEFEPKETWGVQVHASPAAGFQLSVNYGRTIFGRKAEEPFRSEWSYEGYTPNKPSTNDSGAVRLEVRTTVGHDLSLGWSVSGTRRIGEFTRMGLGVGLEGKLGIVYTVTWSRLGQNIKLPIAMCPLEHVSGDLSALAVIVPWAIYSAVEFGYLRPKARRRQRQEISQQRKKLRKSVGKRKAESEKAIRLMGEQVRRRQEREADRDGLVILSAEYGCPPESVSRLRRKGGSGRAAGESEEEAMIDVTVPVAALVDQGQLVISAQVIKSQIIGFYDPSPLRRKLLRVRYRFSGREHVVEAWDGEGITCPMRSHLA
ncbi:hypothetical protein FQN52_000988 [Onygenales sp. PD_12]|nr:hypothetical protein FQN53_002066 [Emmonsiellopsis sp. PD_33]KAK2782255.1 hypothetical protein FQN52_000988 [Onygenales sp. PD_12]